MKKNILFSLFSAVVLLSALNSSAQNYILEKTIALPGNRSYDYVFIDQADHQLYASHGTTVNVVDLKKEKVTGTISGMQGVHGIATVN